MVNLVFDSDGLIKIAKSGLHREVLQVVEASITEEVERETVVEGKRNMYEDAYRLEELIEDGTLSVRAVERSANGEDILRDRRSLGEGERSALHLYFETSADAIVSDDRAFLSVLEENDVPFIRPVDLLVKLSKDIGEKESLKGLKRMGDYVREKELRDAVKTLEGRGDA